MEILLMNNEKLIIRQEALGYRLWEVVDVSIKSLECGVWSRE